MADPTLGSVTLYGCETIRVEENGNIIPLTMPTEGSDETEVFDLLGVIRMVNVNGTFTDSQGGTSADTKANNLMNLVTGLQNTINFTDHNGNVISVMVASVNIIWDLPGFKCTYSIKLIRGKQI